MHRIEIDLNARVGGDLVPACFAGPQLLAGTWVLAYEPEDGVVADAVVDRVETGKALLRVDWRSLRDDTA